jgi:hypothetical protein
MHSGEFLKTVEQLQVVTFFDDSGYVASDERMNQAFFWRILRRIPKGLDLLEYYGIHRQHPF